MSEEGRFSLNSDQGSGPLGLGGDLARAFAGTEMCREPERYGDVTLSIQASQIHYCSPRRGDASVPLEHYESVEIALWWTNARGNRGWITKPSADLGIDGFDDLWSNDDVAGWVPLPRVGALQVELARRAQRV